MLGVPLPVLQGLVAGGVEIAIHVTGHRLAVKAR